MIGSAGEPKPASGSTLGWRMKNRGPALAKMSEIRWQECDIESSCRRVSREIRLADDAVEMTMRTDFADVVQLNRVISFLSSDPRPILFGGTRIHNE